MAPIGAKLCQNAFQTIPVKSIFRRKKIFPRKLFGVRQHFLLLRASFRGRTGKRVSKSNPSHFFASSAPIMRSVRPKIGENMSSPPPGPWGGVQVLRGTSTWLRDYHRNSNGRSEIFRTDGKISDGKIFGRTFGGKAGFRKFSHNCLPGG